MTTLLFKVEIVSNMFGWLAQRTHKFSLSQIIWKPGIGDLTYKIKLFAFFPIRVSNTLTYATVWCACITQCLEMSLFNSLKKKWYGSYQQARKGFQFIEFSQKIGKLCPVCRVKFTFDKSTSILSLPHNYP